MSTPTDTTTTRNPAFQAARSAIALERIAADLLALIPALKGDSAAKAEEIAAEIWAHSDALMHAATEADLARLTGPNARTIR